MGVSFVVMRHSTLDYLGNGIGTCAFPYHLTLSIAIGLQVLVDVLYPIYLKPLKDGSVLDSNSSKLHFAFQPSLLAAKAAFDSGAGWRGALDTIASQDCL